MSVNPEPRQFVSLGLFIIDEFTYEDDDESYPTEGTIPPQIGGGGTYAAIGARIWLDAQDVGMIIDRGIDFPPSIHEKLDSYGADMWLFRDGPDRITTRGLNYYIGGNREFKYLTPRVRLSPTDLKSTKFERPKTLHFICSPSRAFQIMTEVEQEEGWSPTTIYEPIPDRCVPEQLPALVKVLPLISILSPNAKEALSLLSIPLPQTKPKIEEACKRFLELGLGKEAKLEGVIIRSDAMGAYVATQKDNGCWIDAYWTENDADRIVDVTGAGNAFLGGLAAGLAQTNGDLYLAALYATVSASFVIEQRGLPSLSDGQWNGDNPLRRLDDLRTRPK